ncbi:MULTISPECIES: ExbD/TolR family protein [Leptospira]|uniref:Biopolymer transporter ExbD n=4 Tax=Leptospira kirschneri TaxID=29507 RepID=A0A1T1DLN8_9LEPT|nr:MULTISPECIES: biopolymer transporter ExbD [Leptospira]EMO75795.1 transport energizing protein, ExbD/TolR family [Leptospira kirschneri str. 200801925]EJO68213.1 transport energizing protein, ExbD/TolR family [Leptospira kirschneri serovar Grippotyphosa str. RM52]EKO15545.1 transport energizing protein, ExbD/TolR family [Leptospira kirschneri str. H1]EKO51756.1 transport energizing protein, ExbD/TolR family [Leptospira kirschneri str. 200802841]EKO59867.1 transport energizing protein, ExbD/T
MIRIKKKRTLEEISASSMSDIAFLLLVFFMVTAVFFVKEGLNIQLPRKNSNPTLILRENIYEILVTGDLVKMKNKSIGTKEYRNLIDFRQELNLMEIPDIENKVALIKTTGDTKYGNMLDALSAVQIRGFKQISVKRLK